MIENYVRLNKSIQVTLVPANDMYLDKKGFKWQLNEYNQDSLALKLKSDHPKYISVFGIDVLKVTFTKTDEFLAPLDERNLSIPDGFTQTINLPP